MWGEVQKHQQEKKMWKILVTNLLCIGKGIILANVTLGRASKRILFFVLESATADLNNISAVAGGGSCTAAAFLKVFFIVLYTVGL